MSIQLSTRVMHVKDQTTGSYDTVDILKGSGIDDVQVNGTSVVNQGVANVPWATDSTAGVLKVNPNFGTSTRSSPNQDTIIITKAGDSNIKNADTQYRPIVPSNQHLATFYGLAKAASDTTQSASSNPVGTYTDEAKIAIQKMLGIYEPPWELLNDITLDAEGGIDLTADSNGTPYDLLSVYMNIYYPANTPTASVGYARYYIQDNNSKSLYAETGKFTTQTSAQAKFLYVMRSGGMAIAVYSNRSSVGSTQQWVNKDLSAPSVIFDFGNIKRIYMNSTDVEPAGTRIRIYGQRAY